MSSHGLTIQIPIVDSMDNLISKLRFLETKQCRAMLPEADRVKVRALVTQQFRQVLKFKEFTHKVTAGTVGAIAPTADYSRDDIYA